MGQKDELKGRVPWTWPIPKMQASKLLTEEAARQLRALQGELRKKTYQVLS